MRNQGVWMPLGRVFSCCRSNWSGLLSCGADQYAWRIAAGHTGAAI